MNDHKSYTVTIRDQCTSKSRTIQVSGKDSVTVHKEVYITEVKKDEEIESITNSNNDIVFDLREGFNQLV